MRDLTGRYGCVSTGTSLADLAIDRFESSIFNHAFLVVDANGSLIEATPQGVRHGNLGEYAKHPVVLNTGEDMTDAQRALVALTANGYVGRKYGWDDILRLGLSHFGLHVRWLDHHVSTQMNVICSELVAEVGHAAGLDWSCGKQNLADVTPGLLAARDGMEPYTP
jgi:hypothetical protein